MSQKEAEPEVAQKDADANAEQQVASLDMDVETLSGTTCDLIQLALEQSEIPDVTVFQFVDNVEIIYTETE